MEELFQRANFPALEKAIEDMCQQEGELRAALKLNLRYLIKNSATILKGHHLINNSDDKAKEVDRFLDVFQMKRFILFGDAEYKIKKNRQLKLKKPGEMPNEEDLQKLRMYTVERIAQLTQDKYHFYTKSEFVELRDLAITRLTIFNARRGGEPARLKLEEWHDAEKGAWIDSDRIRNISKEDNHLLDSMKIAYQSGKGNKLVSLLIPGDVVLALEVLADTTVRQSVGIDTGNKFIFPFTSFSSDHASGWHSMRNVVNAIDAQKPSSVTATKIRHRTSTLFSYLITSQKEKQNFYDHMGHSADINRDIYQAPPAVSTILDVGRRLQNFDKGNVCYNEVTN